MRSPAEYFLKFLASDGRRPTADVWEYVGGMGLIVGDRQYVDDLTESVRADFPADYQPGVGHWESDHWLRAQRIYSMWYRTPAVDQAVAIVGNRRLRQVVEAVLLSPLPASAFALALDGQVDDRGLKFYRHYFFNPEMMTDETRLMLIEHVGDLARVAVDADPDIAGAMLAHAMGRQSFDVTSGFIGKKLISAAAYKLLQLTRTCPSAEDALMLRRYASSIVYGQQIMAQSTAAADEMFSALAGRFEFDLDLVDHPIVTYKQLTDGHAVDEEDHHDRPDQAKWAEPPVGGE